MRYLLVTILCILVFCFVSCQVSESIYLNNDGSGKIEFDFDEVNMMKDLVHKNMQEGKYANKDTSYYVFKEILLANRNRISKLPTKQRKTLKALKHFLIYSFDHDEDERKMIYKCSSKFKNIKELQDIFTALNLINDLKIKGVINIKEDIASHLLTVADANSNLLIGLNENSKLNYSFKKGVFKRKIHVFDTEQQKELDSLKLLESDFGFYANSRYTIKYHFPKRIKSVSNENALFSDDGKTVVLEYGFIDYTKNRGLMNLEIVLED